MKPLIPIRPVSVINGLALILTVFPHTPFAYSVSDWQLAISVGGAMAFVMAGAVYALAARRQRAVWGTEACWYLGARFGGSRQRMKDDIGFRDEHFRCACPSIATVVVPTIDAMAATEQNRAEASVGSQ